ncbi:hypothetical protein [Sphaerisporangium corydalis]|uniref:Uncharacterized protein n=1 Tax=Sphaerisporangium corydalis TaxID=1441875 RepID=A0ABV9EQ24_9ACTN|nr:hypothetical protein [Sphaerisporangium corydalis]
MAKLPYVKNKKVTDLTGKEGDDKTGCPEGTARRSFEVAADFEHAPTQATSERGIEYELMLIGLAYKRDGGFGSTQDGLVVTAWRKEVPGITFMLVTRSTAPNIVYSGRSDCLPDGTPKVVRLP